MYYGFRFHRPSFVSALTELPIRPVTLPSQGRSRCSNLSYWYREHTAKDQLPIVFIHGIGVGLHTYADFLAELNSEVDGHQGSGQAGVIAVEILSISSRICPPALAVDTMRDEIRQIADGYGWREFVLVGHS